jgi:hypothetical protein
MQQTRTHSELRTRIAAGLSGTMRLRLLFALLALLGTVQSELFSQNTYTFTNAGATGDQGPTQALINTAYSSTSLNGSVTINPSQGIQRFVVPVAGVYSIQAWGAGVNSGFGAKIGGTFNFTTGQVLYIAVGQQANTSAGGHGGTFIGTGASLASSTPVIVAGGGGGNGGSTGVLQNSATYATAGNPGNVGFGGSNGNGGQCNTNNTTYGGGGGGGYLGNGVNTSSFSMPGTSFINGATGGQIGGSFANTTGGFGGGGSGHTGLEPGGGGGYSGGGGGGAPNNSSTGIGGGNRMGGGGGSYNSGISQSSIAINNVGQGLVVMSYIYSVSISQASFVTCNGGSTAVLSTSVTGGVGPYMYSWSPSGGTGATASGIGAGVYTVTVTDANLLVTSATFTVTQPSALGSSVSSQTNVSCNGAGNGAAIVTPTGGTAPYTYTWTPSGINTATATGLVAGIYTVTIMDANNCAPMQQIVSISQPPMILTSVIGGTNVLCNGGATGSASITASGGTGAYTYSWSNSAITPGVSGLVAGAYTVTVTDANGCISIKSVAITEPAALISVIGGTNVLCNNGATGSASITASGGAGAYTYSWSNTANTPGVSGLVAGLYTVTVTDANSCTSVKTITLTQPGALTLTAASSATGVCSGSSATLTASGSGGSGLITYTWVAGPSTNTYAINPSATTIYTVNITDANACPKSETVSVTAYSIPSISVNSATICTGNTLAIIPTGAGTYTITGGNFTVSPAANTSYSITGTSTDGCVASNTAVSTVSVNTTPTVSVNNATICTGVSVAITPTGAATYTITGGNFTVTPLANTNYSVAGTGTNGCISNTAVASVSVNITPTISVNSGSICSTNSFTINPTGAASFTVSGGTLTVSPVTTTSYVVTGTGTNGCISDMVVSNVTVSATPTITIPNYSVCVGETVTVVPAGAGINGTYTITGGSYSFAPVVAGMNTYTVTGTSAEGCISGTGATTSVTALALPTVGVMSDTTICSGATVNIVPTGAANYSVNGVAATAANLNPAPIVSTSYSITGATNGCVGTTTAVLTVSVNALPNVTASATTIICMGEPANLTASGANTYTWSTGQTGASITTTAALNANTTYTVTGTDVNGCSEQAIVTQITDVCTGVNTIGNSISLGVYPNPNQGEFMVETNVGINVSVINSLGQVVYSEKTTSLKTTINISHLNNGIYFVKATAGGEQHTLKLIKE